MTSITNSPKSSFSYSLHNLIEYPNKGIFSKVLWKDHNSQFSLLCLKKGTQIGEHTANRQGTITVIEGQGTLTLEGQEIVLVPGVFVFIAAQTPHALEAQENLAFVLTLTEPSQPKHQVSQKTIDIVKSTAPILKKQGKQITTRMYEIMFLNHPEIKAQFDLSAQANGSQPAKLANAVYSYAAHIDNLETLTSMVEKIAHRHVQTHVRPEQYPIVGESLLRAIKDVLGDAATEEIMAAWTEAYQVLAEVFINTEQQIYDHCKED